MFQWTFCLCVVTHPTRWFFDCVGLFLGACGCIIQPLLDELLGARLIQVLAVPCMVDKHRILGRKIRRFQATKIIPLTGRMVCLPGFSPLWHPAACKCHFFILPPSCMVGFLIGHSGRDAGDLADKQNGPGKGLPIAISQAEQQRRKKFFEMADEAFLDSDSDEVSCHC